MMHDDPQLHARYITKFGLMIWYSLGLMEEHQGAAGSSQQV